MVLRCCYGRPRTYANIVKVHQIAYKLCSTAVRLMPWQNDNLTGITTTYATS